MIRFLVCVVFLVTGCAAATPEETQTLSDTSKKSNTTQTHSLTSNTGSVALAPALDVIFVVDNSSGMEPFIQRLRTAFPEFSAKLKQKFDPHYAVISRKGNIAGRFEISNDLALKATVDMFVGSTNSLALLASSLCDANETHVKRATYSDSSIGVVCQEPLREDETRTTESIDAWYHIPSFVSAVNSENVKAKLSKFFREKSQRVFVFVSDSDPLGVNDNVFLKMMSRLAPSGKAFAFRGTENSICDVRTVGTRFENLANATGGLAFDVCDESWEQHFAKIVDAL